MFVAITNEGKAYFHDENGKFVNTYNYDDYNSNDHLTAYIKLEQRMVLHSK